VEHPQRLMAGHGHRQIVACEHLSGLAPRSFVPARLLLKATPGGMCTSCRGSLRDRPAASLMEMAPLAFGWDPRAGIGAPSDVPAVDLAVAQLDGRRGPPRGALGTGASRKACTYARSWSIRACT